MASQPGTTILIVIITAVRTSNPTGYPDKFIVVFLSRFMQIPG
jgi:hypothetical protein